MENHKYRLTYDMTPHPEGVVKSDIPKGHGATDAALVCSLVYPPDGSLSFAFFSLDGRSGKPLDHLEIFKVWGFLAHALSESASLGEGHREICRMVDQIIRDAILEARKDAH